AQIIIGVFDGDAVFTFVPAAFGDEDFRQLVGLDRPSQSIVASGELTSLVAEYGLTDNMVGLIDIVRLTSTFLDEPSGLNAVLLQDFEVQRAAMTAGACGDEIREMADIAPRMIFGYTKIDASRTDTLGVIELRNDIAAGLAGIAAPVPGMGSDPGGLISFGMSFNIEALKTFIEARLDAIEADPYECEHFQELQAGVPQARGALAQPVPEFIYGFRGFNFVLDAITGLDLGSEAPPESVDGSVVLSMEDAPTMFAMGAMMNPMLASLNLEPDGVPVELQIPQLATMAEAAFAAMTDNALAISIGADAEDRVGEVLDAPVADPAPFLSASMDARWYYGLMAESMLAEENAEGENPMPEAARNALADAMMAFGDMYDRMYFDMRFTTRGLEMNSEAFLAEE
ncbi:MAG: hypothetical protein ACE5F8_09185, partial [Woeseiaceae bacterium]